ncbi:MAG: mannose-6-phosphate isomerase [Bacteroidetes bacterium 4572_117]|nr:MAG: mannose-6-phosphate isomerase [Bacteroidetes bacterium 4572_117]
MEKLYPLKFKPILKEKIWGGEKLKNLLGKKWPGQQKIGESWEISAYQNNISVVSNGFLANNNLNEIAEIYMGDLVGDKVYGQFGAEFPLLIKFIDANDDLSIQVHPDDSYAMEHHKGKGKTEMWYIVQAEKGAELISGFSKEINKNTYLTALNSGNIKDVLNSEKVSEGDVFFIPAGRIHAIGPNILLAEIQQTSDLTYRIYDWGRLGNDGKPRELHTEMALEVMDFDLYKSYKTEYKKQANKTSNILSCPYFTTNILNFDTPVDKDYNLIDSFVVYMCIKGSFIISYNNKTERVEFGETVLLPAVLKEITLIPEPSAQLLEIYII